MVNRINAPGQMFPTFQKVEEKDDSGQFEREFQRQKKQSQEQEAVEVTDEKVESAIEEFNQDQTSQLNGLRVTASGKGPGLRLQLEDSQGRMIRQMSGEEFLRLRDTVAQSRTNRGKILDQKI